MADASSLPLRHVVLCCTSVPPEQRVELASRVEQMGGIHKADLTADVTHLIVGFWDTPKYRYVAKERPDVKVLRPEWVTALRDLWMSNEPLDLDKLEKEYTLPTFANLKISLTGFADPLEREGISRKVTENGGEYHANLVQESTHLIAFKPTGEKYKYAKIWNLRIVSLEWLLDSAERGMVLDEQAYDPLLPRNRIGVGALRHRSSSDSLLLKRPRDEAGEARQEKRKLRRTASAKLGGQNLDIWNDIIGGEPTTSAKDSSATKAYAASETIEINDPRKDSMIHISKPSGATGLLHECKFYLQGFKENQSKLLRNYLQSHGGKIYESVATLSQATSKGYIIIPHNSSEAKDVVQKTSHFVVSQWWVERCLHLKEVIDPTQDISVRPFLKYPITGFEGLIVSSTGFSGSSLLHVSKAIVLMGAKYDQYLTPETSVIICNDGPVNEEKLRYAKEWKVPAVRSGWLWESIREDRRKSFKPYLLPGSFEAESEEKQRHAKTPKKVKDTDKTKTPESKSKPAAGREAESKSDRMKPAQPPPEPILISSGLNSVKDEEENLPPPDEEAAALDEEEAAEPMSELPPLPEDQATSSTNPSPGPSAPALRPRTTESYSAQLATLLERSHRPKSDPTETKPTTARPRRLLGRVTSNPLVNSSATLSAAGGGGGGDGSSIAGGSTTAASSVSNSARSHSHSATATLPHLKSAILQSEASPYASTPRDPLQTSANANVYVGPSQKLGYVDVEAEKRRAEVEKRVRRGVVPAVKRAGAVKLERIQSKGVLVEGGTVSERTRRRAKEGV